MGLDDSRYKATRDSSADAPKYFNTRRSSFLRSGNGRPCPSTATIANWISVVPPRKSGAAGWIGSCPRDRSMAEVMAKAIADAIERAMTTVEADTRRLWKTRRLGRPNGAMCNGKPVYFTV